MIVPDANLLIYAYDSTAPLHRPARAWWEEAMSGVTPVGVPWVVVLAFTRLMTHPDPSTNPMTVEQARDAVASWLERAHVRLLSPGPETFDLFFSLLANAGTAGNLSTDAMIAAVALEHGGRVYTNDGDFQRFSGVPSTNPLG